MNLVRNMVVDAVVSRNMNKNRLILALPKSRHGQSDNVAKLAFTSTVVKRRENAAILQF